MRRLILLLAIAFVANVTMAQKRALTQAEKTTKSIVTKTTQKSANEGTIYWSEDFNSDRWMTTVSEDGEGYLFDQDATLPEAPLGGQWINVSQGEATTNRDAMYFHWSDVGPRGRYSSNYTEENPLGSFEVNNDELEGLPEGTSVENGFMILEGDYANTTESGVMPAADLVFDMDAYVQCGPIDLSDAPGAMFNIKTLYRYCCSSADSKLSLEISVDYDAANPAAATWGIFQLNNISPANVLTFENQVHFNSSERDMSVNISRMLIGDEYVSIAGSDNVHIRLHQTVASHYFWIIDDLSITEPPLNDMVLTDGFADYMYDAEAEDQTNSTDNATNFYGGYTVIPEAVAGPFVKFRAAVVNNGQENIAGAKATVSITKDGEEVFSAEGTDGISIDKYVFDTVRVVTDYTPSEAGTYQAIVSTSLDGEDGNPDNNQWKYDFKVGGNAWSKVYYGGEARFSGAGPRDWSNGGYDGDACVQEFIIPEEAGQQKVFGINTYIYSHRGRNAELSAIENGEIAMYARVWRWDADLEERVQTNIASSLRTIKISDTASWITLSFIDDGSLFLEGGEQYWVGVEIYTGNVDTRFMLGADLYGPKQPYGGGLVYLTSQSGWYLTNDNYAIDLILGETWEEEIKTTFNFDINNDTTLGGIFDAETDSIFITGSFNGWAEPGSTESVRLYKSDLSGVYAGAVHHMMPSTEYEYKYFVGSGWDNGLSANNLTMTTGEENGVNIDVYGSVTSIEDAAELSAVEMYPNPFSNSLTITNAKNVTTVTISNVVGQLVKTINVDQAEVEISTADLEAGIYVISVTDANNNVKSQRVVKQ